MKKIENTLTRFWAKTSDNHLTKPNAFHPLICHLTDVGVVTQKIWEEVLPTATKERIAKVFGETIFDEETLEKVGSIVAFIAGLHDLGKCSPPFTLRGKNDKDGRDSLEKQISKREGKDSEYLGKLRGRLQTIRFLEIYKPTDFHVQGAVPKALSVPHGYVTTIELPEILVKSFGFNPKIAEQIGVLIGGHHGVFPNSDWRKNGKHYLKENLGNEHWANARIKLTETLANLLQVEPISTDENSKLDNAAIMILAGLVSVADWIGSDTQFFECEVDDFTKEFDLDLDEYFESSKIKATKALEKLGWLHWAEVGKPKEFFELFPNLEKYPPRGLQSTAIEIAEELKTAGIVVAESPMGEGKTEAAMFLADTWNAVLGQRGIYFALPTQATSNQMFGRVKDFLGERFDKGIVNLQLTHGHSSLSAEFDTLKDGFKNIRDIYEECSGDECVPHVVAAEWFTYRKRGLLAPFGVGTIDQALMAVLQTKHVFVRLFGLAHKTVIIDEVHAYDAYMSTLLERLLEWLAALGSPVILLSATLPKNRRNALIEAYQRGLKAETPTQISVSTEAETCTLVSVEETSEDKYPRISYATDSTIKVRHIKSSTKTQTLHIKKVDENFIADVKAKLENKSGCVAIICNTVKRSQDIYEQLSKIECFQGNDEIDGLPKLDLIHSRFRFCDRDAIEKRVRIRFGKEGEKVRVTENGKEVEKTVKRPDFAVLVSTQIIEQSLDIDFDLMISDLAPIDLLLQRAGRLHRHDRKRPSEFKPATLWIIEPKIKANGLPNFENSIVYDDHILLRTWLELNKKKYQKIEIPTEIEDLIEAIYDLKKSVENLSDELKDFWKTSLENCLKAISDNNSQAEDRYIKRPGYSRHISGIFANNLEEDSPEIHKTLQAVTRLTEPTVTVICLWEKDGKVFLDENFAREINISKKPYLEQTKELLRYSLSISNKSVVFKFFAEEVPKGWEESALLRHHRIFKFDANRNCEKFGHIFRLDEKLGLTITKQED